MNAWKRHSISSVGRAGNLGYNLNLLFNVLISYHFFVEFPLSFQKVWDVPHKRSSLIRD